MCFSGVMTPSVAYWPGLNVKSPPGDTRMLQKSSAKSRALDDLRAVEFFFSGTHV